MSTMTLYKRRQRFSGLSVRIGNVFSSVGLTPNQWTLVSLVPAAGAFYFMLNDSFLPAGALFILSAFLDMVDGAVARSTGRASKRGAYLDTMTDRYVEAIVVFGLLFASLPDVIMPMKGWVFLLLFGGMLTTYAKSAAREKGLVTGELRGGLLERADRIFVLFLGILAASWEPLYLSLIVVMLAVLTNVSAIQRMRTALGME